MSPWKRQASTGNRSGTFWRMAGFSWCWPMLRISRTCPAARATSKIPTGSLTSLLRPGTFLICAGFVPDGPTQEMCTFLRTRKQFVHEKGSHILRIQKTLEDANIKLDSVITDIIGVSGRKMIEALIAGERDPAKLASFADRRLKASQQTLRQVLRGRVTAQHRFLLRLHLDQIDALDAAIARIDREVEASIVPFRTAVEQVRTVPGIKSLAAQTILSEIGIDMSRFSSSGHLISWACICPWSGACPRSHRSAGRCKPRRSGDRWRKSGSWACI